LGERIHVVPGNLESGGASLRKLSAELRSLANTLSRQYQSMDWDVRVREMMAQQITGALRTTERMAVEAESLGLYLARQARTYGELDQMLARSSRDELSTAAASLQNVPGAAAAAVAAAAASAGAMHVALGGALGKHEEIAAKSWWTAPPKPVSNLYAPRPEAPPAPTTTGLPTPEQVKYMQWVLGIDEDGYGEKTKAAVAGLQRLKQIGVDPEVMIGPATWKQLEAFALYRVTPVGEPSVRFGSPLGLTEGESLKLTSHWGDRPEDYIAGHSHWGLDLIPSTGRISPVTSATSATVLYAGEDPRTTAEHDAGFGNVVVTQATDGTVCIYAHMEPNLSVRAGDQIAAGEKLGTMGNSGASAGAHLHFEVWRGISGAFTKGGAGDWYAALRSTRPQTSFNQDPLHWFDPGISSTIVNR